MDMALRPEMARFLFEKFTAFYCEDLTRALEATNGRIHFASQWSDYGMQDRALLSLPSDGIKFRVHSCGAIRDYIPELIEIGMDLLARV